MNLVIPSLLGPLAGLRSLTFGTCNITMGADPETQTDINIIENLHSPSLSKLTIEYRLEEIPSESPRWIALRLQFSPKRRPNLTNICLRLSRHLEHDRMARALEELLPELHESGRLKIQESWNA